MLWIEAKALLRGKGVWVISKILGKVEMEDDNVWISKILGKVERKDGNVWISKTLGKVKMKDDNVNCIGGTGARRI